uniref:Calponin-homology (CH) domain-containing protein n=1 Tax=Haemonchus contortus TaxID=6289 RepID=A0A7I4XTF4_HAECO
MELDSSKENALLFWFNTYGTSIDLDVVDSLQELWPFHIPSLLNCLRTNENTKVMSNSASSTFQELYSHLASTNDQDIFIKPLSVEKAAQGDSFEIAKFLAVFLNEFRISNPDVIRDSVALMQSEGKDEPLRQILSAFDEEQADWWSVMISRSDHEVASGDCDSQFVTPQRRSVSVEEFCGMSVNRSVFATPCGPTRLSEGRRKNNAGAYTVARCDGSPLMDVVNSPKVRELRELRRDREIRVLRKQLHDTEDQLSTAESQIDSYKRQIESLIAKESKMNVRIRELEASERSMLKDRDKLEEELREMKEQMEQSHDLRENQRQRIAMYKSNEEETERKISQLTDKLKAKESALTALERLLRDRNDDLASTMQSLHALEAERDNLSALLEGTKQSAESEKEQYLAAVSEWRKRCETETSEKMSLYSAEMVKNAALQQQLRLQSEKMEELQKQYEESKRASENALEEVKQSYVQKLDRVSKRLAEVEADLVNREERHKSFVSEHEANVRQLESAHLADVAQRDSKLRSSRTRIDELESSLTECNHVILQQRKELSAVAAERDKIEDELSRLQTSFHQRDIQLSEAKTTIDELKSRVDAMEARHNDDMQSMESLQADCACLQASIVDKDSEIFEMTTRLDMLASLSDLHNSAFEQARQDLEEERKRHSEEESTMLVTAKEMEQKLNDLASRNSGVEASLVSLQNVLENDLDSARREKEKYRAECEALREKDMLRSEQLKGLEEKFEKIEWDLAQYNKRNSELELQVAILEEENAQFYKCIELSNMNADKDIKMRFPDASVSKGTLRGAVQRVPSPVAYSIFLTNEDEPSVCQISTTDLKWMEMEATPTPNPVAQKPPRPKSPSKAVLMRNRSSLSLPTASAGTFGSWTSLNKSNSKGSLDEHKFAVPEIKDEKRLLNLATDRSRIAELQKRNSMLHPAMRCAYGTEVGNYSSPSGSENVVKQGSARRKSAKFFQRASSYVKKKLPMSESTNFQK